MAHDYHPVQAPVLSDGCGECENASQRADRGIGTLDPVTFQRAWIRAAAWNRTGTHDVGIAESRLLAALWAVQVQLERRGIPIGEVPHGV